MVPITAPHRGTRRARAEEFKTGRPSSVQILNRTMGRDGLAVGLPENRSCGHLLPMSGRCDESLTVKPPAAQAGPRGSERFTRYCGAGRARSLAVGLETTRGFGATINSARTGPVRAGRWQPGTELLRAWQAERPGHCVRRDSGSRPPERIRNGGISPHARATTPAVQNGNGASGRHRRRRGLPRSGVTVCACPRRTCAPLLHAPFRLKLESGHSTDPAHERGMGATQQPPMAWDSVAARAEMSWAGPPSDCDGCADGLRPAVGLRDCLSSRPTRTRYRTSNATA
jgi:hypothetical protein